MMLYRLLGAALAVAISAYPVQAMQSRDTGSANNALATCVLSLIVIGLPLFCKSARLKNASAKGKAQVTIHKPEGGKCANGNTYRIVRVADVRSVCRNSIRGGSSAPACVNLSTIRGKTVGMIIIPKSGAHLEHEIEHVCRGPGWNH